MPKPNKPKISPLAGKPKQEILNKLRNTMKKASKASLQIKSGRTNRIIGLSRGIEAENLSRIANNKNSANRELAGKLLKIFLKASKGEMVADELGFDADHKALTRILVKVNSFERQHAKAILTDAEKKVFERYENLL
jgi:hypothetical protein